MQSINMRDLCDTFEQFNVNFDGFILPLYAEAHIFILETWEKLGICYRIMLVLLLFMTLISCKIATIHFHVPQSITWSTMKYSLSLMISLSTNTELKPYQM